MAKSTKAPKADGTAPETPDAPYSDGGRVEVQPLMNRMASFLVTGTMPYLQLKFSQKAKNKIYETQQQGEKAKSRKVRTERNFESDYEHAAHVSEDGWHGIPATAFKAAMVSACRLAGIPMTRAKLLVHVKADGLDAESGDGLIRIVGKPEMHVGHVRNANGSADLRVRAIFKKWSAVVNVQYDASCIGEADVLSLIYRAGQQVGIGEGRADSKKSCGMGYGFFDVELASAEKSRAA